MVVKVNVSTASFPDLFLQFMSTIEWGRSRNEAAVSTCTKFRFAIVSCPTVHPLCRGRGRLGTRLGLQHPVTRVSMKPVCDLHAVDKKKKDSCWFMSGSRSEKVLTV